MSTNANYSRPTESYADQRRRMLEFTVGDQVFLKIAPMKGVKRFGKKGKLSPRYIDPFTIIERIGNVAYKLDLPSSISQVHNVFHISMLRKYIGNPSHVLRNEPNEPMEIKPDLTYEEKQIEILQLEIKQLRSKKIPLVKILWRNQSTEEATWEREDEMRIKYPELFGKQISKMKFL
ncbi:uncharacterized protein LOC111400424 [Olea europaea var. sylvestris]|uniref:uncharacterized protein LOC111400424 n=1 Tax=Olea europaea var. sylvestris TaxID=158386 RepID=UPI000C1CE0B3|nr:uncharacterized protein LOC111400424 [Olea europaea var. sylvestris]